MLVDPSRLLNVNQGAEYLLGCEIVRTLETGEILRAKIVETESYHQNDPASHTYGGKSNRNQAMFGPPGHTYIYFTYGMHWCFNVTAAEVDHGAGILIRAAEPLKGIETMQKLRSGRSGIALTNGPAKLAQALMIDKRLYNHDLQKPPLQIYEPSARDFEIVKTTRIGISKAVDEIARYYIKNNPYVSKK